VEKGEVMLDLAAVFQVLVLILSGLTLLLIKTNDQLISLRRRMRQQIDPWAMAQRHIRMVEVLVLIGAVIYGHVNHWEPWIPVVIYAAVRAINMTTQTLAIRCEIRRLEARRARLDRIVGRQL
jgi:hypothetical protein